MTEEEIYFIYHYQNKTEQKNLDSLGKMLGVIWDLDEAQQAMEKKSDDVQSDRIVLPLSMVINPKVMDIIKNQKPVKEKSSNFIGSGTYIPKPNEKIVSMGDLSKEEFYKMIGKPMPSKLANAPKDQK